MASFKRPSGWPSGLSTHQQFGSQVFEHIKLCASWHAFNVDTAAKFLHRLVSNSRNAMPFQLLQPTNDDVSERLFVDHRGRRVDDH